MKPVELRRNGVTRLVLLVGPWAIKVPRIYWKRNQLRRGITWGLVTGVAANLSEVEWSGVDGVNPVLFTLGGLVNVYRRLPIPTALPSVADDSVSPDGRRWWSAIAPDLPCGDAKRSNLGVANGRVVWIDYSVAYRKCPSCLDYDCRAIEP